jgi:hypothetical protein
MEATVFEGLRAGTRVLKEIHSEMSIEAVEDLMADTREALQHQEVRAAVFWAMSLKLLAGGRCTVIGSVELRRSA